MRHLTMFAVLIAVTGIARADENSQCTACVDGTKKGLLSGLVWGRHKCPSEKCVAHHGGGIRHFLRRRQPDPPLCAKPCVDCRYRYEPHVRDIRMFHSRLNLPGHDSGIHETLPVIPPRMYGYFVLPRGEMTAGR